MSTTIGTSESTEFRGIEFALIMLLTHLLLQNFKDRNTHIILL